MSTPESTRAISQDRKKGKNVSALRGLLPFLKPYKILVATGKLPAEPPITIILMFLFNTLLNHQFYNPKFRFKVI